MTNQVNFKTIEVMGYSKAEAFEKAPFQIFKDATTAWKKAGMPISQTALKSFCSDYLAKSTKFAKNLGCSITFESAVADSRERPYQFIPIKNESGKRSYKTGIQGIDKATGDIKFTVFGTKKGAQDAARKLYTEEGYRGDIYAKYVKEVVEGEVGAFEVKYAPSKSAKQGRFILFGVENND